MSFVMSVTEFPVFFRVSSVTRKRSSMTCARSFTRYFFLNKLTRFTLCTYSSFFIILRPWIKKFFCFPWVAGFKGSRKKELSSNSPFRLWSPHPFLPVYACISRHFVVLWPWSRFSWRIERLRFTFTPNGKREFVERDQVFPLIVVNCLVYYFYSKNEYTPVLYIRIVLDSFYLLIFYFEKFSTWIWRFPFALNVTLNLSNIASGKETSASSRRLMKKWREYFYEFPLPPPLAFNAFHASY